jgi:hypothetical protein
MLSPKKIKKIGEAMNAAASAASKSKAVSNMVSNYKLDSAPKKPLSNSPVSKSDTSSLKGGRKTEMKPVVSKYLRNR